MPSAAGVLFAPGRTFEQLAAGPASVSLWRALRQPALLTLLFGTCVAMTTTGHVDPRLVVSTTLYWSLIPLAQLAIAWVVIATASSRVISTARAIEVYFVTTLPWSLWLLAFAAWSAFGPAAVRPLWPVLVTMIVPCAWTLYLLYAFSTVVLRDTPPAALRRVLLQQVITWSVFVLYYGRMVALWPHVIGWFS